MAISIFVEPDDVHFYAISLDLPEVGRPIIHRQLARQIVGAY